MFHAVKNIKISFQFCDKMKWASLFFLVGIKLKTRFFRVQCSSPEITRKFIYFWWCRRFNTKQG